MAIARNLPQLDEVLLNLLSHLPLRELSFMGIVDKDLNRLFNDNHLWQDRYKLHFPKLYKSVDNKNRDWRQAFQETYEYYYPPHYRRLFASLIEEDLQTLASLTLDYESFYVTNVAGRNITSYAQGKPRLQHYLYNQIKKLHERSPDKNQRSLLHWAVLLEQPREELEKVITSDVDIKDVDGETPLMYAARVGNIAAIDFLVSKNAQVDYRKKNGVTALYIAAAIGQTHAVDALLRHNAFIGYGFHPSNTHLVSSTALHAAIRDGNIDIVRKLITPLTINHIGQGEEAYTPLGVAALYNRVEIAELLLEQGAELNYRREYDGLTPLTIAVMNQNLPVLQALLRHQPDLDLGVTRDIGRIFNDDKPIHIAVKTENFDIVKALLDAQDNPNRTAEENFTPLHYACCRHKRLPIVKLLLDRGANINAVTSRAGRTPLMFTSMSNRPEIARELLQRHAQTQAQITGDFVDNNKYSHYIGDTALHIAARCGHAKVVEEILKVNRDVSHRNIYHQTVLTVAGNTAKPLIALLDYRQHLQNRSSEFKYGFSFLNHDILKSPLTFFGKTFNIGRTAKIAAVNALIHVALEGGNKEELNNHHEALSNGNLSSIYKSLKI